MNQCEHCLAEISDSQKHATLQAVRALDAERRQYIANTLGMPACPETLCASCLNPLLTLANAHVFKGT